jgi:hypothetical protein
MIYHIPVRVTAKVFIEVMADSPEEALELAGDDDFLDQDAIDLTESTLEKHKVLAKEFEQAIMDSGKGYGDDGLGEDDDDEDDELGDGFEEFMPEE